MGATSAGDNALTEASFREFAATIQRSWSRRPWLQRVRFDESSPQRIAYPRYPWTHHDSIVQDGERFDIWLHWDGRARIEHDGQVILRMWAPAAEIFRAITDRRQASG